MPVMSLLQGQVVAEKIIFISEKSHKVIQQTNEVKTSTDKLAEMCSKFKV